MKLKSGIPDKIPSAKIQKRTAEDKLQPISDYLVAWNHVRYIHYPTPFRILKTRFYSTSSTRAVCPSSSQRVTVGLVEGPIIILQMSPAITRGRKNPTPAPVPSIHHWSRLPSHTQRVPSCPSPKPNTQSLYDITVAVIRTPGDLLHGMTPDLSKSSKSGDSDLESDSDSEESTNSVVKRFTNWNHQPVSVHVM
jgi:hypothetical protein